MEITVVFVCLFCHVFVSGSMKINVVFVCFVLFLFLAAWKSMISARVYALVQDVCQMR